jgi:hypothetical protein
MDTSLFYPGHLGLSPKEALTVLLPLVDNASRYGGVLTINWHDRSLAPERLWDSSYRDLIGLMKSRGAWFATAGQAVTWFRKRRSVVFETEQVQLGAVRAKIGVPSAEKIPGLRLRTYKADSAAAKTATGPWCGYSDAGLDEPVELGVS